VLDNYFQLLFLFLFLTVPPVMVTNDRMSLTGKHSQPFRRFQTEGKELKKRALGN
jgi:hypothetical protein